MYQFNMSVDKENAGWFRAIEKVFSLKMRGVGGVVASKENDYRIEISAACDSGKKAEAVEVIKCILSEMYLTVCKFEYLSKIIDIPRLDETSYKILLHTLVAFDREAESEIIDRTLGLKDFLSLDGFFNFRLGELRKRWDEIAGLASNNAFYLNREETLNELLKFLMSAITPKIQKLSVLFSKDSYRISGRYKTSSFEFRIPSSEALMIYLINIAPLELTLEGEFKDEKLYKRIVNIFDGKSNVVTK